MTKAYSRFLTALFCLFLGGLMVWQVLLPDRERSDVENRTLAQWPEFSWESLKDGSYTAGCGGVLRRPVPPAGRLDGTEGPDRAAHRKDGVPRGLPLRRYSDLQGGYA